MYGSRPHVLYNVLRSHSVLTAGRGLARWEEKNWRERLLQAARQGEEVTSLYRAVAKAELDDIVQTGFRQHPDGFSLESKLFATSSEDAARFGRDNFRFDRVPFHIIEVQVPTAIADQFEKLTLDLKPALSISRDMLLLFNQHATVREITPIPTR